jgi:hypothetical protein
MTADSPKLLAWITTLLGLGLVVMGTVLVYVLVVIWPAVTTTTAQPVELFGVVTLQLVPDAALLLLVVVSSALGGFVHAATSFATYVGNRALALSWVWWYLLRIFIGAALAVIFYLAIRGGFLAAQADTSDVNPYGMAALAGLVGLFSKQATDKLEEVFTTLFRVQDRKGDALRKDKVALPAPRLVAVAPSSVPRNATAVLRLLGEGFAADGRGDVPAAQRVESETAMELTIDERALDEGGALQLVVVNPAPGGGTSNALVIQVEDVEPRRSSPLLGRLRRTRK